MKWLPLAATLLLSLEVGATSHSNNRHVSCYVGNNPNRGVRKSVIDANFNSRGAFAGIGAAPSPSSQSPLFRSSPYDGVGIGFGPRPRRKTSLNMGIRDMFGRRKKEEQDDEQNPKTFNGEDAKPEDIKLALEAIKADLEAVSGEKKTNKKKKAENVQPPISKASASVARKVREIVQQPQRKPEPTTSASTYGESVRERINRVKSGHMTEEEKAQFLNTALTRAPPGSKGPKIRQEIPSPDGKKKSSSSASPVRKDALWNTVIGSNSPINRNDSPYKNTIRFNSKGERLDDSAKREYLDMVTNPERFSSYAAMGGYKNADSKEKDKKNDVVDNLNLMGSPSNDEIADMELANRLETAAIMKEKEDAKMKAEKEVKKKSEMEKFAADQRKRQEEAMKREEAEIAAKRAAEEKKKQAEREKIDAENKRMADLQAAQDAYWANKLKSEKKTEDPAQAELPQVSKEEAFNAEQAAKKQAELAKISRLEKSKEQPVETVKAVDDTKSAEFVEEQEQKKAKLDQFMKEQKDRLASLSSPLPFQKSPVPKAQPRKPNSASSPPPATIPSLNLTDLTMKKSNASTPVSAPVPAPPSADSSPRLSLAEMTMLKKSDSNGNAAASRPVTPTRPAARSSSGAIRQSVPVDNFDDDDEDDDFFEYARSGGNSNMSIKDIMAAQNKGNSGKSSESDAAKQKSKMWGIDIDAFMD